MPTSAKPFRLHDGPPAGERSPISQAAANLLNSKAWRRTSKAYLAMHPMCAACARHGRDTFAVHVHHTVAHRGDPEIFWDESTYMPLCHSCHSKETAAGR